MLSIVDDDSWYADLARDVDTAPPAAAVAGVPTDAA
jgi:hypothetical protein